MVLITTACPSQGLVRPTANWSRRRWVVLSILPRASPAAAPLHQPHEAHAVCAFSHPSAVGLSLWAVTVRSSSQCVRAYLEGRLAGRTCIQHDAWRPLLLFRTFISRLCSHSLQLCICQEEGWGQTHSLARSSSGLGQEVGSCPCCAPGLDLRHSN